MSCGGDAEGWAGETLPGGSQGSHQTEGESGLHLVH